MPTRQLASRGRALRRAIIAALPEMNWMAWEWGSAPLPRLVEHTGARQASGLLVARMSCPFAAERQCQARLATRALLKGWSVRQTAQAMRKMRLPRIIAISVNASPRAASASRSVA